MSELKFSPVDEIIADLKAGKLVIVADDPGRENEADLVGAASLITPESIAFMANHGRGLICTPITPERTKALDLSPMTPKNREAHKTATSRHNRISFKMAIKEPKFRLYI